MNPRPTSLISRPSIVSAGFEPAISTMSRWRALQAAPRDCVNRAGRSRTCLVPRIRRAPRRSVHGPNHCAQTHQQNSRDGRNRTLAVRFGGGLLHQEHTPVLSVDPPGIEPGLSVSETDEASRPSQGLSIANSKDARSSNPRRPFWRRTAHPGAHPCRSILTTLQTSHSCSRCKLPR